MKNKLIRYIFFSLGVFLFIEVIGSVNHKSIIKEDYRSPLDYPEEPDSTDSSDVELIYPFNDPLSNPNYNSPLFLNNPSNITNEVIYDPENNEYIEYQKIGDTSLNTPKYMDFEEYQDKAFNDAVKEYWRQKIASENFSKTKGLIPQLHIGGKVFDKVFGGSTVDITPNGSAELIFGVNINKTENPQYPVKRRKNTTFDFEEKIQMNITGKIGDKVEMGVNYNTEALFEFENKMKLEYEGDEDDIIKKIEAGNVTLPLTGTLIQGSQSLFGFKTALQFGKTTVTTIFSQQKGKTSSIELEGGAQVYDYEVSADDYEANKHFFLAQYFKENYNKALENLPLINSSVNITKIEVWVTNKTNTIEDVRNIVAFADLGEDANFDNSYNGDGFVYDTENSHNYPDNYQNNLYVLMDSTSPYNLIRDINLVTQYLGPLESQYDFTATQDYEKITNARKLKPTEFEYHSKLGYISLNSALNADEVLAVAFQYTVGGKTFQVGEFSQNSGTGEEALYVKLLKSTMTNPQSPLWGLMMKNIYAIGAYQVSPQDFTLHVLYSDVNTGTLNNYITEGEIDGKILLKVMNLDNVNYQSDPYPDGVFDFMSGITINPKNGRIIFPVLEPFGDHLRQEITQGNTGLNDIANKYVFDALYDSTKYSAQQMPELNKFRIHGSYKSSVSSEISLNAMNIPQGSVIVTAGGIKLTENVDYTVDYTLGRVKIINEGVMNSGTPIRISLESNELFNIQTKNLIGTHVDYKVSDDINLGATILNLTEKPITQKTNFGDEAISNTIWGLDGTFHKESRFITKMVDKLPFLETKEMSSVTASGEFAHLIPGHSKAIGKTGTSYIDDFEGSQTYYDIKAVQTWKLSSTPQGQSTLFPEAELNNTLGYGFNRALLAWYRIDPLFNRNDNYTPDHIKDDPDQQSSHYVREVLETEIFPNKETPNGQPISIPVLNMAFYPSERGPYNFDVDGIDPNTGAVYGYGINADGTLKLPEKRWGGIMRRIETNDFEAANIEFIEFWLMDPFAEGSEYENNSGGDFYINLGNISEDILRDSRRSYENGLPTSPDDVTLVDTTVWGRVPSIQALVNAFDNNPNSRPYQDVGYDGLRNADEQDFFNQSYLQRIASQFGTSSGAYQAALYDPANDDFIYFRGDSLDQYEVSILDRYKKYNGVDGNSPAVEQTGEDYSPSSTTLPDIEDINRDNTLSDAESYFQYQISLRKADLNVGTNYITDMVERTVQLENGDAEQIKWYQFKIPLRNPDKVIGSIQDFKSIRFIRMFMKDFEDPVVLRFARMDLVRGEWRKYNYSLKSPQEALENDNPGTNFDVSSVSIEENGDRIPVNYVLPPGIEREVMYGTSTNLQQLNEQSLSMRVCGLEDGDARACYKTVELDVRQYKRLKMYVHAESGSDENGNPVPFEYGDLTVFIRLGTDFVSNYYEYEIPLNPTQWYESDDYRIWPESNALDLAFELFQDVKQRRNNALIDPASNASMTTPYSILDGDNIVSIVGSPNLSDIKVIMLGVRNPKKISPGDDDDGLEKCAELWLNELRLTDFNEKGGWAANARVSTQLADFGQISMAGFISTPGFGSIEKKVNERSKELKTSYDISTNLELGKFLPEKSGVSIPMYYSVSEEAITPQYYPLDPDILLKDAINNAEQEAEKLGMSKAEARDSIKRLSQDLTQRKSINFTNVRKNRSPNAKIHTPIDLSNFAVTYAYTEMLHSNVNIDHNTEKTHMGALTYNYNIRPKIIEPFKKSKFLRKTPALRLIKDFNFYYAPSNISFRTDVNRRYNETLLRNVSTANIKIDPTFNKQFDWNRVFSIKYDLTKALKLDFSSTNNARILEPEGQIVSKDHPRYAQQRDSILQSVYEFGETQHYMHQFNANYAVPINKLPLLDWTNLNARYAANYDWQRGPKLAPTNDSVLHELGHKIQNSNSIQLNGQLNFVNLYNKIGYLKKINTKQRRNKNAPAEKKKVKYKERNVKLTKGKAKTIRHDLDTKENVTIKVYGKHKTEIQGTLKVESNNKVTFMPKDTSISDAKIVITAMRPKENNLATFLVDNTLRLLMSTKNANFTYTESNGTVLPGFTPEPYLFGMRKIDNKWAPGLGFAFGKQDENFAPMAASNGWLSKDSLITSMYGITHTENFSGRISLEPLKDLRVDLNFTRQYSKNAQSYFLWSADSGAFDAYSPMQSGNFSMSIIAWNSAFFKDDDNYVSEVFETFKRNRLIIAERLSNLNEYSQGTNPEGYPDGYGPTSQDVLISAFLAAYTGQDPANVALSYKGPDLPYSMMRPNWRVTYNGLSKIDFLKQYFKNVTLEHSYKASYNVGSYNMNLLFQDFDEDGFADNIRDANDNFLPKFEINAISVTEQFSPLVRVNVTMKNSITANFEIKKTRNLSMSFSNSQLTEVKSNELVVGVGYRVPDVQFKVGFLGGGSKRLKSDLNIKADFSIRNNSTIIRKLMVGTNTPAAGQHLLTLKITADYVINERFNIQLFFDRIANNPLVSSSFPTANTDFGISIRFTLAQ